MPLAPRSLPLCTSPCSGPGIYVPRFRAARLEIVGCGACCCCYGGGGGGGDGDDSGCDGADGNDNDGGGSGGAGCNSGRRSDTGGDDGSRASDSVGNGGCDATITAVAVVTVTVACNMRQGVPDAPVYPGTASRGLGAGIPGECNDGGGSGEELSPSDEKTLFPWAVPSNVTRVRRTTRQ